MAHNSAAGGKTGLVVWLCKGCWQGEEDRGQGWGYVRGDEAWFAGDQICDKDTLNRDSENSRKHLDEKGAAAAPRRCWGGQQQECILGTQGFPFFYCRQMESQSPNPHRALPSSNLGASEGWVPSC